MKTIVLFSLLIGVGYAYAQDYPDSIYYNSGARYAGKIIDEDILTIQFLYLNKSGKEKTKRAEKDKLIKYRIGNPEISRFSNYTSTSTPKLKRDRSMSSNMAKVLIVGITGTLVAVISSLFILGS